MGAKVSSDELGFSMLRGRAAAALTVKQTGFLLDVARREGYEFDAEHWTINFPIHGVPYLLYRHPNKAGVLQPCISVRCEMRGNLSFEEVQALYARLQERWESEAKARESSRIWVEEYNRVLKTEGFEAAREWVAAHAPS